MSCGRSKGCGAGECSGCCKGNGERVYESSFNSIVELEIHYSEEEEAGVSAYIFESLYCLTNMQGKDLRSTGLEGNKYDDLDTMKLQVIDYLRRADDSPCGLYNSFDVSYIKDDI